MCEPMVITTTTSHLRRLDVVGGREGVVEADFSDADDIFQRRDGLQEAVRVPSVEKRLLGMTAPTLRETEAKKENHLYSTFETWRANETLDESRTSSGLSQCRVHGTDAPSKPKGKLLTGRQRAIQTDRVGRSQKVSPASPFGFHSILVIRMRVKPRQGAEGYRNSRCAITCQMEIGESPNRDFQLSAFLA